MDFQKKFISIRNEIKKFLGFMEKTTGVSQLTDSTVFPWALTFAKNVFAGYREYKSSGWNYLVFIHEFENVSTYFSNLKDLSDKRLYLIKKYNERLLFYSDDKANPWVIDDTDKKFLVLCKKNYLEFKKQTASLIDVEIDRKITSKTLTEKNSSIERKRLSYLAKLVLLQACKEKSVEDFITSSITSSEYRIVIDQFKRLITQELKLAFIQSEIKKTKKNNKKKVSTDLTEVEPIKIYSISSIWERINKFRIKNKLIQFLLFLWNALISHANLLNWISVLLIFLSLSLCGYPIIFCMWGTSLIGYLIFHSICLLKKDSVIFSTISIDDTKHIVDLIKIEVFNEEKSKNELKLIGELVDSLSRESLNLQKFLKSTSSMQKKFDSIYLSSLTMKESKLYHYLTEVYPKTQFVASLVINLMSTVLYTYLVTWAIQNVLAVIGVLSMAAFIGSPIVVGVLILVVAALFLGSHLVKFRAREDCYQRTVLNKLNEMCDYRYEDEYGREQIIQIQKWKKFECLQDNIHFLESAFKNFFEENNLDYVNTKFYSVFNHCILNKNTDTACDQDKVLGGSSSGFKTFKKFLNRSFAFFGGGFYGYNIGQQIVWKSNLGLHTLVKTLTLPIFFIFFPLIIIMSIANFITYHLHSRQRNLFELLNNLDSRLELLEQINKKLLFLKNFMCIEHQHFLVSETNIQADLSTANKNNFSKKISKIFSFFKEIYQKESALEKKNIRSTETVIANACLPSTSLTNSIK